MASDFGVLFALSFLVTIAIGVAILLLLLPLPPDHKSKLLCLYSRAKGWLWVLMAVCIVFVAHEWWEQTRSSQRRSPDERDLSAAEMFKHQRNMYLVGIPIIMAVIFKVLMTMTSGSLNEANLLQEQLEARNAANKDMSE
jgi:predicted ABC-type exoprotein transport system permease subunit